MSDNLIYTVLRTADSLKELSIYWEGMRILVQDERHIYRRQGDEWIDEGPVTNDDTTS